MKKSFKRYFNKFIVFLMVITVAIVSATSCTISFGDKQPTTLKFTLTQEQVDSYVDTANDAKTALSTSSNIFTASSHVNNLVNGLYYINEQYTIAQIEYFKDMTIAENKDNYDFAVKAVNTARASYKDALKTVWNSNSSLKDTIFDGISEIEANALFNTPDEVNDIQLEISTLTADYLALSDEEFSQKTGEIYSKIVTNYNKIATITSFENYYVYSSGYVYERDYEIDSLANMKNYIKEYVFPLYVECVAELRKISQSLTDEERAIYTTVTQKSYREQNENYVLNYVNSLPHATKRGMYDMFERNNYYVATSTNAYDGAFTASLNYSQLPYCYFGPSYQDCFTIIHELGHYYADYSNPLTNIPLDIAEIHSQANELLFLNYLQYDFSDKVYNLIKLTSVLDILSACIVSTVVNDFEIAVFTRNVENYTSSDFDALMLEVIKSFDLEFFTTHFQVDFLNYWKRACIQQPCYYVSYAVSGVAALALYAQAIQSENDYLDAINRYDALCTADFDDGLSATLDDVKMLDPFEKNAYTTIYNALSPTQAD